MKAFAGFCDGKDNLLQEEEAEQKMKMLDINHEFSLVFIFPVGSLAFVIFYVLTMCR